MQKANQENVHQIYLYDDITEYGDFNWATWNYEDSETSANYIKDILQGIPDDAEIEVYINSDGGSVKEGTAIFNMLKRHPAQKTGYVDGVAHSIAFTILQACDKRIMGAGTSALIHNPWMLAIGDAEELQSCAAMLESLAQSSRSLLMQRATGITETELADLMQKETMLTPEQALSYGFCDEIIQHEKQPTISDGIQQKIREVKQRYQKGINMDEEVQEFAKNCNQKSEETEKKGTDIVNEMFSAFFEAFASF